MGSQRESPAMDVPFAPWQVPTPAPATNFTPLEICMSGTRYIVISNLKGLINYSANSVKSLQKYLDHGSDYKNQKHFHNFVNSPLVTGPADKLVLDLLNLPSLHILLG